VARIFSYMWIFRVEKKGQREKKREKVDFPFKKRREEGNKEERGKEKINMLEIIFSLNLFYG